MNISFAKTQIIFDTLPIGYYLGRSIDITLSETSEGSYFDPAKDCIIISYPCIAKTVTTVSTDMSDEDIETLIRGLVYHEVSHVILTPKNLMTHCSNNRERTAVNILEDERIETLFRDVYMLTDFKKNVLMINNYDGTSKPKNKEEAFYHLVRFHQGEKSWLERLHTLIRNHSAVNSVTDSYNVRNMARDYIEFYNDFMHEHKDEDYEKDSSENKDQSESSEENTSSSSSSSSISSMDSDDTNESSKSDEKNDTNDDESKDGTTSVKVSDDATDEEDTDSINGSNPIPDILDKIMEDVQKNPKYDLDGVKRAFSKVANIYYDAKLEAKLTELINSKLKKKASNGSAINAYSGRLNPKSVGLRDDYKWWAQKNRAGHMRQFTKVHFNLFIDNSGSFSSNDIAMNTFIRTLDKINIPDFTFDVITINTKIDEWKDTKNIFDSYGGNILDDRIQPVFIKHQKSATNNVNIVLFDGDAHSDDEYCLWGHSDMSLPDGKKYEPFKHFDSGNTIIISDRSNEKYINRANMSKAKVSYTSNYVQEFIDTVINLIDKVA